MPMPKIEDRFVVLFSGAKKFGEDIHFLGFKKENQTHAMKRFIETIAVDLYFVALKVS